MKHKTTFSLFAASAMWILTCGFTGTCNMVSAAEPIASPVQAEVYSTMPSTDTHSPVMAMDGDPLTYYKTVYGMNDGDDFIVLLSRPVKASSVEVVSGDSDGKDLLTNAVLETSSDTITYTVAASFNSQGIATAQLKGKAVMALRVRLKQGQDAPHLVLREITVNSPDKIVRVLEGPGRGFVDISREPQVAAWAAKAESQMEAFWPDTAALLYSPGFITPNAVNVVYTTGPGTTGIAATGGGVMTVNTAWCEIHPDDTGLTVHETAHVIQAFGSYDPVWLIEGEADYIRWVKYEPQHFHPRINVATATYQDSYQTTATFLGWCENHYDNALVTQLNRAVRVGKYNNDLFKQYCGKDVDTLWTEFVTAYAADPIHILTPPVPAADLPRTLPTVTAGTSTSVDLSGLFNTKGLTPDGVVVSTDAGIDGQGSTYSADELGSSQTANGVKFSLGAASANNVVSSYGNVILLPTGTYKSLWLLGTAVQGHAEHQLLTITYSDGSTQGLWQNFSDWFQPEAFPGESQAIDTTYRNVYSGAKDPRPFYIYSYGFALDGTKQVKSVTLPNNSAVKILAVSVAN